LIGQVGRLCPLKGNSGRKSTNKDLTKKQSEFSMELAKTNSNKCSLIASRMRTDKTENEEKGYNLLKSLWIENLKTTWVLEYKNYSRSLAPQLGRS
jgi:hypothetical protein